jgi:hypothetical protein
MIKEKNTDFVFSRDVYLSSMTTDSWYIDITMFSIRVPFCSSEKIVKYLLLFLLYRQPRSEGWGDLLKDTLLINGRTETQSLDTEP